MNELLKRMRVSVYRRVRFKDYERLYTCVCVCVSSFFKSGLLPIVAEFKVNPPRVVLVAEGDGRFLVTA